MNETSSILPGSRVIVFDSRLYVDDRLTPLSTTMRPATVVRRYGKLETKTTDEDLRLGNYPDLVDVVFDHRPFAVSNGHFTSGVKILEEKDRIVS